jgi:hypothetical protein
MSKDRQFYMSLYNNEQRKILTLRISKYNLFSKARDDGQRKNYSQNMRAA